MLVEEKAGTLMVASEAIAAWEDSLSRLRVNLRGFPDRVVPRMAEGANDIEKLAICRQEMDKTLRSIVAEQVALSEEEKTEGDR